MAEWYVSGKTYRTKWVNPIMRAHGHPEIAPDPADESVTLVFVFDDAVPKHEVLDTIEGDPHTIATKASTAVGNALRNRVRIEFLRLLKQYPYGMEAGAIGLDGGGDPRAHPNQRDKAKPTGAARINAGLLLQPGEFPADKVAKAVPTLTTVDAEPGLQAALAAGDDIVVFDDPAGPAGFAGPTGAELNPMLADRLTAAQIEDDRRAGKGLDPKPRFDTVNPPLSELPQRAAGAGHDDQGTGYDSGAAGHELQGRASAPPDPDPDRDDIMRHPDGSPVIGPTGPTHAPGPDVADLIEASATLPPATDPVRASDFVESVNPAGLEPVADEVKD